TSVEEDFDNAVDRTFMTYRFGTEFIGKDYLRNFNHHVTIDPYLLKRNNNYEPLPPDRYVGIDGFAEATSWVAFQRGVRERRKGPTPLDWSTVASYARIAEAIIPSHEESWYTPALSDLVTLTRLTTSEKTEKTRRVKGSQPPGGTTNYLRGLTELPRGREFTSVVEAHGEVQPCLCDPEQSPPTNLHVRSINNLVFDFSRYELKVTPEHANFSPTHPQETCASCAAQIAPSCDEPISRSPSKPGLRYRVDISPLQDAVEPFAHAGSYCSCGGHRFLPHCICRTERHSCRCNLPRLKVDAMECLGYQHLDHVHLDCHIDEEKGKVSVLAIYGGIAAM
ncbi:hypothetical protein HDU96_010561, partial [Phlyctochytrium bullatum]